MNSGQYISRLQSYQYIINDNTAFEIISFQDN
jgi:hypothetical protein